MFRKNNKEQPAANRNSAPTIIAKDMSILGNLMSEGVVDVDGKIDGNVKGEVVTIRSHGVVKGDVSGREIHVYGEVKGVIRATTVVLYASCRVEGIIMHESLTIEDGAFVDGKFKRTDRVAAPANDDEFLPGFEETLPPEAGARPDLKLFDHLKLVNS